MNEKLRAGALDGVDVLVVDDDADSREVIGAILRYAGAFVTMAASASEALVIMSTLIPDVILADIAMPENDGYMLLQAIQLLHTETRVPVIAVTGYGYTHPRERTLDAGFREHLSKPLDPVHAVAVIARIAAHGRR